MKKTIISFANLFLIVLVTINLVSCQKEKTNEVLSNNNYEQCDKTLKQILDFKNQLDYYKINPGSKDANYISVGESIWNLEALFNYTYAYPELCYGKTEAVDTVLFLPISANDSVLMSDLAEFYNQMFQTVNLIYQSVTLPNKQFIILDVEEGQTFNNQVEIHLYTTQGSVEEPRRPLDNPFAPGEWWYYGENFGGWNQNEGDAAEKLTYWLNLELTQEPPEGSYYYYTNIRTASSTTPSYYPYANSAFNVPDQYCEFEVVGNPFVDDTCLILNSDQLNFHYYGELYLIHNYINPSGQFERLRPFRALVESANETNEKSYTRIYHHTTAWYGIRETGSNQGHQRGSL